MIDLILAFLSAVGFRVAVWEIVMRFMFPGARHWRAGFVIVAALDVIFVLPDLLTHNTKGAISSIGQLLVAAWYFHKADDDDFDKRWKRRVEQVKVKFREFAPSPIAFPSPA